MRLRIRHVTRYTYERPLSYGLQELRLTPKSRPGQQVLDWRMTVEGGKVEAWFDDQHMNRVTLISFTGAGHEIVITAQGEVEIADTHGIFGQHQGFAPLWLFERQTELTRAGPMVRRLLRGLGAETGDSLARLHALSARIGEAVTYRVGATDAATAAEAVLERGAGVCQDHTHVFLAAARLLGFPARYVSGYLMIEGREDQEASHAWAEAHVNGLGWVGFDVANGISPDARYVRVATGLDYREAAPVSGLRFGDHGRETLAVQIQVQQ